MDFDEVDDNSFEDFIQADSLVDTKTELIEQPDELKAESAFVEETTAIGANDEDITDANSDEVFIQADPLEDSKDELMEFAEVVNVEKSDA